MSKNKVITVFESEMLISADGKPERQINSSLLNHTMQYFSAESEDDFPVRRFRYRVIVEEIPIPEQEPPE